MDQKIHSEQKDVSYVTDVIQGSLCVRYKEKVSIKLRRNLFFHFQRN